MNRHTDPPDPAGEPALILASASPRRAELLGAIGLSFTVMPAEVDESRFSGESPEAFVRRIALAKAGWVQQRRPRNWVVAADTVVVIEDGEVLGKPADDAAAAAMLRRLSGRTHRVLTGVAVSPTASRPAEADVAETAVRFRRLEPDEIRWYVAGGEPLDKAGAYGIQGRAAIFVEHIRGSYANVVGLPTALLHQLMCRAGFPRERFWS